MIKSKNFLGRAMDNLLITGANGFVGKWAQWLLKTNYNLFTFDDVDISQYTKVVSYLKGKKIDKVIHLAAQSFVPASFEKPLNTYHVNFFGTYNIFQALQVHDFSGKFLHISTSDIYGRSVADFPVLETHLTRPLNPYSVSKCASEALAYQWSQTADFDVIIARPFNHIGPGQRSDFVVSDFAKQCVAIKNGCQPPVIATGDIDVFRDFTDVRDVVKAYACLLEHGVNGEFYNVCSGKGVLIRDILQQLIEFSGLPIDVVTDPARLRKTDIQKTYGSYAKILDTTDWKPEISLERSLLDIFNYWDKTNE